MPSQKSKSPPLPIDNEPSLYQKYGNFCAWHSSKIHYCPNHPVVKPGDQVKIFMPIRSTRLPLHQSGINEVPFILKIVISYIAYHYII